MKKKLPLIVLFFSVGLCVHFPVQGQTKTVKKGAKYDTIIVKHVTKPAAVKELTVFALGVDWKSSD